MLPSKGKFSLYACPYLYTSTCGRPYCQFSHAVGDASSPNSIGTPLSVQPENEKANEEEKKQERAPSPPVVVKTEPEEDDLVPQLEALFGMEGAPDLSRFEMALGPYEPPKYQPTPISELKSNTKTSIIESLNLYVPQEKASKPTKVAEYVPLPVTVKTEEYDPTASSSYVPTKKASNGKEHKQKPLKSSSSKHSSSTKKGESSKSSSSKHSDSKGSSKSSSNSKSHKSSSRSHSSSGKSKSNSSSHAGSHKKESKSKKSEESKSKIKHIIVLSDDQDNDDDDELDATPITVNLDDIDNDDELFKDVKKRKLSETKAKTKLSESESSEFETAPAEEGSSVPEKKRRIAHASKIGFQPPRANKKIIRPVFSMGQVLSERWKKQQEKKQDGSQDKSSDEDAVTKVGCQPKGKTRVAHQPKAMDAKSVTRPKITPTPSKIPAVKRQYVLDQLFDMCLNVYEKSDDASSKALELELAIMGKATTSNVYTSVFISQKRLLEKCSVPPPLGEGLLCFTPAAPTRTITTMGADSRIQRIDIVTRTIELKGDFLHKLLSRYLLSEQELHEHSFPLPHKEEKGRAVIHSTDPQRRILPKVDHRECLRCGVIYKVNEKGMPEKLAHDEPCIYHPKRTYKKRRDRTLVEDYYMCCDRPFSSEGCESNRYHVSENPHFDHLTNFVTTKRSSKSKHKTGVYALDCEMCLTTNGSECTRVTVIDEQRNNIYDALVKPDYPVLDYLTRFSGITEEMLNSGKAKRLKVVQTELLQIFRAESILIGHSLQGDLKVLKMIHKNVVDTSIVFPHREGLPKRRALKNLAKDFLMRLIQVDENGHDSSEDALACMDLMLFKAKEDAKSL